MDENLKVKLAESWRRICCDWLGYAYCQDASDAQSSLGSWAFYRRHSGATSWKLEDVVTVARDYGVNPAELICRLFQDYDGSTLAPIAEKLGLTVDETERRFSARLATSRLSYPQLYLLILSDQERI